MAKLTPVVLSDRGDAVEMVVKGPWTPEATEVLRSGQADRLYLNYALGFEGTSLEFLEGAELRELVIVGPMTDLAPIHSLASTLEVLKLSTNSELRVDIARLPRLRTLGSVW